MLPGASLARVVPFLMHSSTVYLPMESFVLMFHSTHSMPSARETLMTLLFTSPYGGRIRRGETPSVSAIVSAGKTICRIML